MSIQKRQPDLAGRPTEVVQRIRLRYAKRGRLRFTSHRDLSRAFERAIRRAAVPMAYSSGFTAHPRISWLGAAPTGAASEAEYVEIGLASEVDPAGLLRDLDAALPPGVDVLDAVIALPGGGKLAERFDASRWELRIMGTDGATLRPAVEALLAATSAPVERVTKEGKRTIDVRAALVSAAVVDAAAESAEQHAGVSSGDVAHSCAILQVVVRQTTPVVRPDDVLAALSSVAGLPDPVSSLATRLEQGRLSEDGLISDPLAADRDAGVVRAVVASQER